MKFSSQEEYSLRCLLQIARKGQEGSLTIPEIAKAEGLTVSYVGKLLRALRREGFVKSVRGQSGGYTLSRHPSEIKLANLFNLMGGRLYDEGFCERFSGTQMLCTHSVDCSVRSLLSSLQNAVDRVLDHLTLESLLKSEQEAKKMLAEQEEALALE